MVLGRVLFVGEGSDGPPLLGRSGRRLAALAGLPGPEALLDRVEAVNLFDRRPPKAGKGDGFPLGEAQEAASRLVDSGILWKGGTTLAVLLGKRVALAFGLRRGYFERFRFFGGAGFVFPHPSGINRWWNDPGNEERARTFLSNVLFLAALLKG